MTEERLRALYRSDLYLSLCGAGGEKSLYPRPLEIG